MADMGAIGRAAGPGAGPMQGAPGPEVGPEMGPEMGAEEVDPGIKVLAEGMGAIQTFIGVQQQSGNPGAEQAMGAFQALVQSMKGLLGGGEGASPELPPEPEAAAPPVPMQDNAAVI